MRLRLGIVLALIAISGTVRLTPPTSPQPGRQSPIAGELSRPGPSWGESCGRPGAMTGRRISSRRPGRGKRFVPAMASSARPRRPQPELGIRLGQAAYQQHHTLGRGEAVFGDLLVFGRVRPRRERVPVRELHEDDLVATPLALDQARTLVGRQQPPTVLRKTGMNAVMYRS